MKIEDRAFKVIVTNSLQLMFISEHLYFEVPLDKYCSVSTHLKNLQALEFEILKVTKNWIPIVFVKIVGNKRGKTEKLTYI